MAGTIAQNIVRVRERIAAAAERAGRSPQDITLIAVSKRFPPENLREAIAAGVHDFGESYVQEALPKMETLAPNFPDLRWHFIGHLQSNKARMVAGKFALLHSIDSVALAQALGRRAQQAGTDAALLLEIKLDTADTKFGIVPEALLEIAAQVQELPGVRLCGLMGMAPFFAEPEQTRPYFRRLKTLFDSLPPETRQTLSMGMTHDFEIAVEEGATHVRIGTGIFGSRD